MTIEQIVLAFFMGGAASVPVPEHDEGTRGDHVQAAIHAPALPDHAPALPQHAPPAPPLPGSGVAMPAPGAMPRID